MDDAERRIAILDRLRNEAKRHEIVDAFEIDLLPRQLQMNAVEALDSSVQRDDRDLGLVQPGAQRARQLVDHAFGAFPLGLDLGAQRFVGLRLEVLERQLLELVLHLAHPQPTGDGGVDVEGFLGDLDAALLRKVMQRPHVVEPVGELHENDTNVIHHRQQHLAEVLGLPFLARRERNGADFCHTLDDMRDFFAEEL